MAATSESCCNVRNGVGEEIPHLSNNKEKVYVFSTTHETKVAEKTATSDSCCIMRNGVGDDIPHLSNNNIKEKTYVFSKTHEAQEAENDSNL